MAKKGLDILFRRPKFPVVGCADNDLFSATELRTLAAILVRFEPSAGNDIVQIVDATGEEFWYSRKQCVLSPGFTIRRWTKQQIIDLDNSHVGSDRKYKFRSFSNKRLSVIVGEIANLILRPRSTDCRR